MTARGISYAFPRQVLVWLHCYILCSLVEGEWILGDMYSSCTDSCTSRDLICTSVALSEHNAEVAGKAKMAAMLKRLGSECASYSSEFGSHVTVPVLTNTGVCVLSDSNRTASSFDCGVAPTEPANEEKRRLCWCEQLSNNAKALYAPKSGDSLQWYISLFVFLVVGCAVCGTVGWFAGIRTGEARARDQAKSTVDDIVASPIRVNPVDKAFEAKRFVRADMA